MKHTLRFMLAALALLAVGPPGAAAEDKDFDALSSAFGEAQSAFYAKMSERFPGDTEIDAAKLPPFPETEFIPKFKALAQQRAGSSGAIAPLAWLASHPVPSWGDKTPEHAEAKWALAELADKYAADPEIGVVGDSVQAILYGIGREPAVKLFRAIREKNPDRSVQATGMLNEGISLYLELIDPDEGRDIKAAEKLFRRLAADYADTDAAKDAGPFLFELDHLQVGMKAPEFAGLTPDGAEIKLSQFAGQVVVLDFWGFW